MSRISGARQTALMPANRSDVAMPAAPDTSAVRRTAAAPNEETEALQHEYCRAGRSGRFAHRATRRRAPTSDVTIVINVTVRWMSVRATRESIDWRAGSLIAWIIATAMPKAMTTQKRSSELPTHHGRDRERR